MRHLQKALVCLTFALVTKICQANSSGHCNEEMIRVVSINSCKNDTKLNAHKGKLMSKHKSFIFKLET